MFSKRKRKKFEFIKNFQNSKVVLFVLMELLFFIYCMNRGNAQTYMFCLPGLVVWSLGVLYLTGFSRFGLLIVLLQHIGLVSLIGINIYSYLAVYKLLLCTISIGICIRMVKVELDHRILLGFIGLCYLILFIFGIDPENTGTTNTVNLGVMTFQITELIKVLSIICMGRIISLKTSDIHKLLWIASVVGINTLALVYFRELGTLLMILILAIICVFLALPKRYSLLLILLGLAGLGCAALYWSIVGKYYPLNIGILNKVFELINKVHNRVFSLNTMRFNVAEQSGAAYRYIVLGGLFGQKGELQLFANYTDFAFANLIYNCGLVIGIIYALGMSLMYMEGNHIITENNPELSCRKNASNSIISILLLIEIMIRSFYLMMMNLTVFPICGIPLPFLSYGLSSTLMLYYCLFLLGGNTNEKKTLFKNSLIQLSCTNFIYYRMRGNILKHRHNQRRQHQCRYFQKTTKHACSEGATV